MEVKADAIKALREKTGAGVMDCKRALEEAGGNVQKAEELLRQKGIASAAKRANREVRQGLVEAYVHSGSRIGSLVEVNCETDFVARTPEFRDLAHILAMQVAAMNPLYLDKTDMPPADGANPEAVCLLLQPYIKDPSKTIRDVVNEAIGRMGENIRVKRFARFALGE